MRARSKGIDNVVTETLGYRFSYYNGVRQYYTAVKSPSFYPSYKVTTDELHPNFPKSGGPLDIREVSVTFGDMGPVLIGTFCAHPQNPTWKYTVGDAYFGKLRCMRTPLSVPTSDLTYTESLGPDAWMRFKPVKPVVGLGQAVAELRDIKGLVFQKLRFFKGAIQRFIEASRKAGGWYLAVQFGWRPMVSDLLSLLDSVRRLDRQIAELRDKNGKYQRKSGTLFDTTDYTHTVASGGVVPWSVTNPVTEIYQTVNDRAWFKGVFRYYIPGLDDPRWGNFNATRELWDLSITPELLWQLMPWSWLIDWASNVGSVISNLQSQIADQVVARYAYVMHRRRTRTFLQGKGLITYQDESVYKPPKTRPVSCTQDIVQETKCRAEASPFGFGLDMTSLSSYQLSILGALGMSRIRF